MIYWAVYYTEYNIGLHDQIHHILGLFQKKRNSQQQSFPEWPDHGFINPQALFQKDGCLYVRWKNDEDNLNIGIYKENESGKCSWMKIFHFDHGSFLAEKVFRSGFI